MMILMGQWQQEGWLCLHALLHAVCYLRLPTSLPLSPFAEKKKLQGCIKALTVTYTTWQSVAAGIHPDHQVMNAT